MGHYKPKPEGLSTMEEDGNIPSITFKRRVKVAKGMVHVLETGLEYMEINNPTGKPAVRGYNIINGQLASASDNGTFRSTTPAHLADCLGEFPLSTRDDVHEALHAAHAAFPAWAEHLLRPEVKSLETWVAC